MLNKKEMSEFLVSNLALFIDLPRSKVQQSIFKDIESVTELSKQGCFTLGMLIERMQHANFGDKEVLEEIKIEILLKLSK